MGQHLLDYRWIHLEKEKEKEAEEQRRAGWANKRGRKGGLKGATEREKRTSGKEAR